tara:strand:+ start:30 stop:821 length:792 start_codon:yes stop_codon:yes gene_type:complete
MGRRIGLGHLETLVENLKRDLAWGAGTKFNGVEVAPNGILTPLLGLNPTWRLNFGGATLAAGSNTADLHLIDKLTPVNVLHRMSLALAGVAAQGTALTGTQAAQIFGETSEAGALIALGSATTGTNVIPATVTVNTLTGNLGATLVLDDSATDLEDDLDQSLILFNDNVFTASQVLTIATHANNEHLRASVEFACTGAGTDVLTRQGQGTDGHQDIILTASAADTTILAGSFIYLQAGAAADELAIKGCIRTTGGTITVTYAA